MSTKQRLLTAVSAVIIICHQLAATISTIIVVLQQLAATIGAIIIIWNNTSPSVSCPPAGTHTTSTQRSQWQTRTHKPVHLAPQVCSSMIMKA